MPLWDKNRNKSSRRRLRSFIVRAEAKEPKKKRWWENFLLQEINTSNWFSIGEDLGSGDQLPSDGPMEEEGEDDAAWKRRVDALSELREFQQNGRMKDKDWEDWLDESWRQRNKSSQQDDEEGFNDWDKEGSPRDKTSMPERGMYLNDKEILFRLFDIPDKMEEDLLYEDKVFQYTSQTTAKFVALLVLVPWAVGFVFHDYVLVPFLNRYVELVPFAAQLLDVRKDQKIEMVETLKHEKLRLHFEAEIRQAPPPSDEEVWEHTKHKARELREELRLENRKAFGNIWSDMVVGITAFLILVFNRSKVEIMKFTGSRIVKGISDTGKAFLLILVTDIFLGYHSESGWHTLIEMLLEHYGLMVDESAITIFICTVPVSMDVCVKLWVFKYLPKLSPSTGATFHEMKRH
jgi:hypothetical protein